MAYELWSGASGNLLNRYETEAEALAAVRRIAAANDREYVAALGLVHDNHGRSRLIAEGEALVQRALAVPTSQVATPPR